MKIEATAKEAPVTPEAPAEIRRGPGGSVLIDTTPKETPAAETPLIAGKFKTHAELETAYAELEKKLGAPKTEEAPAAPAVTTEADAQATAEKAGVDYAALVTEFGEKGELSEATYKKLTDGGIPKEMVDGYIAGQLAIADQLTSTLASDVGGKEQLSALLNWATTNLSEAEAAAYNAVIDTKNVQAAKDAIAGIKAKFVAANGIEPNLIGGETAPSQGVKPFETNAEMVAAMRDKRYNKDAAYTREVFARVQARIDARKRK